MDASEHFQRFVVAVCGRVWAPKDRRSAQLNLGELRGQIRSLKYRAEDGSVGSVGQKRKQTIMLYSDDLVLGETTTKT